MIESPSTRARHAAPDPVRPPSRGRGAALVDTREARCLQGQFATDASGAAADEPRGHLSHSADAAGDGGGVEDAAAAGDIVGRMKTSRAGGVTIGSPPKRRRLRGKQPQDTATINADTVVNSAVSPRISCGQPRAARDDAGGASYVSNSVHDLVSGGPSRLDTFTCYRDESHQNRDGHVLNLGADASGARCTGTAERQREVVVLGHAAGTGRPPDDAGSRRAVLSLG